MVLGEAVVVEGGRRVDDPDGLSVVLAARFSIYLYLSCPLEVPSHRRRQRGDGHIYGGAHPSRRVPVPLS